MIYKFKEHLCIFYTQNKGLVDNTSFCVDCCSWYYTHMVSVQLNLQIAKNLLKKSFTNILTAVEYLMLIICNFKNIYWFNFRPDGETYQAFRSQYAIFTLYLSKYAIILIDISLLWNIYVLHICHWYKIWIFWTLKIQIIIRLKSSILIFFNPTTHQKQ